MIKSQIRQADLSMAAEVFFTALSSMADSITKQKNTTPQIIETVPYQKLRGCLRTLGIRQFDIAKKWGRSEVYVSARFSLKESFTIAEAYSLLNLCQIPHEMFIEHFPLYELKQKKIK